MAPNFPENFETIEQNDRSTEWSMEFGQSDLMEHSNLRKLHNFDFSDVGLPYSQFLGSSSSLSLPSEVPDISNWFSSYVYESPDSDSCDNVGVSISEKGVFRLADLVGDEKEGTEKKRNSCGFKKNEKRNEEISPKEYLSTDFPLKFQSPREDQDWCSHSLQSEPADVRNWFPSYVYESPPIDSIDEFGDSDIEYNQKGKDKLIAEENEGKERISGESSDTRSTYEETEDIKEDNQCSNKSYGGGGRNVDHLSNNLSSQSTAKARLEEQTAETRRNNEFKGVEIEKQKEQVPENSPTPTKSSANSENKCSSVAEKEPKQYLHPKGSHALSEDGFVPIRKSEFIISNGKKLVERSPKNGVHSVLSRHSALADITNLGNSITREVKGKWQCPQKGKPNVGPPLKQLRLEQWVQKM